MRVIPITDAHNDYAIQLAERLASDGRARRGRSQRGAHERQDPRRPADEGALHAGGRRPRDGERDGRPAQARWLAPERPAGRGICGPGQ